MGFVGVILALLAFSVMVIIHELGHFTLAKLNGVKVEEFSVGMGPTIMAIKTKETVYSLKILPFGGSCMMLGEDENGNTVYVSREDYTKYLNHEWNGNPIHQHRSVLQIALNTEVMDRILASTDYEYLLDKSNANNAYLVLFDDTEDHTILYSPRKESIGKTADDIGLGKNAFKDMEIKNISIN